MVRELFHHLQSRRKGINYHVGIKMDMSKAFGRIEWIFLLDFKNLGFYSKFVNWINYKKMCFFFG